ncbi:MAG: TatD family hydrolase [Flavobacteriales bacterium]
MNLIDTHTHLFSKQFDQDRTEVVNRAIEKGVDKLFLPNIDSSTILPMMDLCQQFPNHCYPMMGLHPCDVKEDYQNELTIIRSHLEKGKFIAIGEIGIDLHWDKSTLAYQQDAFKTQLKWAKEFHLPVAIHVRESFDEVFEIIEQEASPELKGVFHCFTGTLEQAKKAIELGFLLGIGGVVTFKKSHLPQLLPNIELNKIILETDSPYLSPSPNRGKRNESSNLIFIAQKMAQIFEVELSEIAKITTQNALNLFRI